MQKKLLADLKESLIAKKSEIEGELEKFATKGESGEYKTDFPDDLGTERSENANEVEEYTDRLGVEKSLETQLTDIDDALQKMEDGKYGIDEQTGEKIPQDRLRAYPAARTNVKKD